MKTSEDWTIVNDATGTRRALHASDKGERFALIRGKDAEDVLFARIRCPDAVFERLKSGATMTDAELLSIEFESALGLPAHVLAALLA